MLNFIVVFCGFFIAVALARIIIPRILIISLRKRLFDTPDARKVHKNRYPGWVECPFPGHLVHCNFLDRNLLYDRMGLLSGYKPTLGTDTVYVYRVDIVVYCRYCG